MLITENPIPQGKTGRRRTPFSSVEQHQLTLSQGIMPAVRGEFYSYSAVFTEERPIYALMKCKSNKSRPIDDVSDLGHEASALFLFSEQGSQILSIKEANNLGLLRGTKMPTTLDDLLLAPTTLTAEQFTKLRIGKKTGMLVNAAKLADRHIAVELYEGLVVAMVTTSGKYGMFLVEEVTSSSVQIEACHILL